MQPLYAWPALYPPRYPCHSRPLSPASPVAFLLVSTPQLYLDYNALTGTIPDAFDGAPLLNLFQADHVSRPVCTFGVCERGEQHRLAAGVCC